MSTEQSIYDAIRLLLIYRKPDADTLRLARTKQEPKTGVESLPKPLRQNNLNSVIAVRHKGP